MNTKTGRKKPSNTPSMYKESKLFHPFGKKDIRKTETLPDPSLENIQPEEEEKEEALSNTKKATDILNSMLDKAARNTMPSEPQAKREYGHSFSRFPRGISGSATPDLPGRGKDWHPESESEKNKREEKEQRESQEYFEEPESPFELTGAEATKQAVKALAGAPILPKGPLMPPTARKFLLEHGYTPAEIDAGLASMTPRMRGMYNRDLLSGIRKSLATFEDKE